MCVSIVAVHGLGGHALKTWTGKNKKIWLIDEEFLPQILPTARVLTFGYNANNFAHEVSSKVMDHADALLAGLLTHRMGNEVR
jgi:predicted ATPase